MYSSLLSLLWDHTYKTFHQLSKGNEQFYAVRSKSRGKTDVTVSTDKNTCGQVSTVEDRVNMVGGQMWCK